MDGDNKVNVTTEKGLVSKLSITIADEYGGPTSKIMYERTGEGFRKTSGVIDGDKFTPARIETLSEKDGLIDMARMVKSGGKAESIKIDGKETDQKGFQDTLINSAAKYDKSHPMKIGRGETPPPTTKEILSEEIIIMNGLSMNKGIREYIDYTRNEAGKQNSATITYSEAILNKQKQIT